VTVDPNPGNPLRWHQATAVKPNRKEAFEAAGIPDPGDVPLATLLAILPSLADRLREKWDTRQLLITLGEHGMALLETGRPLYHTPTRAREVFDVSGAGDTAIALYTLALAAGCPAPQAAEISNLASGVVVAKAGTATLTPEELLEAADG
jgi:D-beta-D-heptose 7-phosphate kinase/D-beta-D-heptose 1-phosphate adenosyltransferase